jgi:hypothetical protein
VLVLMLRKGGGRFLGEEGKIRRDSFLGDQGTAFGRTCNMFGLIWFELLMAI